MGKLKSFNNSKNEHCVYFCTLKTFVCDVELCIGGGDNENYTNFGFYSDYIGVLYGAFRHNYC
ncbi:hypothetical protein J6TS1_42930 [Siminovitchia terrae]|uniref:Uncharacterized protein n=1 Tax=Siminovitchia terrae TaxID=1914933 RepID=A0ABQ4L2B3_SIMTE|nr:hypothetical protein J6TS1_42930 [Siminovitchia terrae]